MCEKNDALAGHIALRDTLDLLPVHVALLCKREPVTWTMGGYNGRG